MANGKTAEQVIKSIKDSKGYIAKAAGLLGVSRSTFYNYLKKYSTAQEALDDVRESRHDYVESKLMKLIDEGNVPATIFYLKTQCKQRGYVERSEIAGVKDAPFVIVNWDDNSDTD